MSPSMSGGTTLKTTSHGLTRLEGHIRLGSVSIRGWHLARGLLTALAAIALENPQYCDTSAPLESSGFGLDTEDEDRGDQGYYNEMSVATLLYDFFDTDIDGSDNDSIGFGPIYSVMTGPQAMTEAFTTLFSFATELRNIVRPEDLAFVDSQLTRENVDLTGLNVYGDNQTIVPAGSRDVLPLYTDLPTDGTVVNICTNSDSDSERRRQQAVRAQVSENGSTGKPYPYNSRDDRKF